MTPRQTIPSLVLATMVFSVALRLRVDDFRGLARAPRAVVAGRCVQQDDTVTAERPGRLVRMGSRAR